METTVITRTNSRQAAIHGLAVVGFVALIIIGMTLAIYAARFVPNAVSRVGSAAVYLTSIFESDEDATLETVPAGTTIPFDDGSAVVTTATTTVPAVATTTATTTTPAAIKPTPSAGPQTTNVYTVGTIPANTVAPYGLADLTIESVTTGYLTSSDTKSFVKSSSVPDGKRGAIKFTVVNKGTNVSGKWEFEAKLPTSPAYTFDSPSQASLNPGERIDFTLGFDKPKSGNDREITINVDSGKDVKESNESNNSISETVDIKS